MECTVWHWICDTSCNILKFLLKKFPMSRLIILVSNSSPYYAFSRPIDKSKNRDWWVNDLKPMNQDDRNDNNFNSLTLKY